MSEPAENDPLNLETALKKEDKNLIEDREKLELNHIPDKLHFRGEEINKIVEKTLADSVQGNKGTNLKITGDPGTGKTAAVQYCIKQLNENYETSNCEIIYINCKVNSNHQEVVKALLNSLDEDEYGELNFKDGVGIPDNLKKFLSNFDSPEDPSVVVVLDEIDELKSDRRNYIGKVLYELTRPNEAVNGVNNFNGNFSVIGVSNEDTINEQIPSDTDGSFKADELNFLEYSKEEIAEILLYRQKEAFKEELFDKEVMLEFSHIVKEKFNGDIRSGLKILKKTAEKIDYNGDIVDSEKEKAVEEAIDEIKRNRIERVLVGKDVHFLLIAASLVQNVVEGKNERSYIVQGYREACEKASIQKNGGDFDVGRDQSKKRSRTYVWRKLNHLQDEGVVSVDYIYDENNKAEYTLEVDTQLFEEMVYERLERKGVTERFSSTPKKKELKEEAEEKMQELM
jgi:Cdc6-like AAA superfamily ATPase